MDQSRDGMHMWYRMQSLNISPSEYVDELYEIVELQRVNYNDKQRLCACSITPPLSAWTRVFQVSKDLRTRRRLLVTKINLAI